MPVGEDVGWERHQETDQFFRVEQGDALVETDDDTAYVSDGDAVVVPRKTWHNVVNVGDVPLKFYTIYSPPHHAPDLVQPTKQSTLREKKK